MTNMNSIKIILAGIAGTFSAWLGDVVTPLILVFAALLLDYGSGMLASAREGKLSSQKGSHGILKKLGFLLLLGVGFMLDAAIPFFIKTGFSIEFSYNLPIGAILCAWIVINETISILENLYRCGVPIPGFLQKSLQRALREIDENPPRTANQEEDDKK